MKLKMRHYFHFTFRSRYHCFLNFAEKGDSYVEFKKKHKQIKVAGIGVLGFVFLTLIKVGLMFFGIFSFPSTTQADPLSSSNADLTQVVWFDGVVYTDQTTQANDVTVSNFTLASSTTSGSPSSYFGMDYVFDQLNFNVGTVGASGAVAWEYWNGSSWTSLSATDNTSNFTASGTVSFTIPSDWQTNDPDGVGSVTNTLYWVRARTTTGYASSSWSETQPAGDADKWWWAADSDSDGSNLIACVDGGRLYVSSNYGAGWSEVQPAGDVNKDWRAVTSNSDGTRLFAGVHGGRLYRSVDSGANWSEVQPAGDVNKFWNIITSDSDGSHIVAGSEGGKLYRSSDYGDTWLETQPTIIPAPYRYDIASNSDGSRLIVTENDRLYVSSDSGVNWTEVRPAGDVNKTWYTVSSDSAGSRLIAGVWGGRVYRSSDSGANWTEIQPAGDADKNWSDIVLDSDGSHLIAGVYGGRVYLSSNLGDTWTETQPAGNVDKNWQFITTGSGSSYLTAGVVGGRIYRFASVEHLPLGTQVSAREYNLKVKVQREIDGTVITGLTSSNFTISGCADTTIYNFREIGLGVYELALKTGQTCNYSVSKTGLTWAETQPAGDVNKSWYTVASNSDGFRLIAGVGGGRLYRSSDYGVTWIETQPAGDVNKSWWTASSNSNGSRLIIGEWPGRLYRSSDYGVTWTETQPAGNVNKNWVVVVSSADGSRLIASIDSGRIYISSDYGVTWTETQPAGDVNESWDAIAFNSTGSRLLAGVYNGRLYRSSDYGVTWTETQPAGDVNKSWWTASSNSDGSRLLAGVYSGRLYRSSDYGVTWTETQPAGGIDKSWWTASSNSDGSRLLAGVYGGRLYRSSDYGVTWTETQPAGDVNGYWVGYSNSDGSRLITGTDGGRLYLGSEYGYILPSSSTGLLASSLADLSGTPTVLQFGLAVTVADELGNAITSPDTIYFRGNSPTATSSNTFYFNDVSGAGSLTIKKDGYVAGETVNVGFSNVTTSSSTQVALTMGSFDAVSSAITISSNVKGLQFAGKVTVIDSTGSVVSGATVKTGDSYSVTCAENGTTGIYYCIIPLSHTAASVQVEKTGYVTSIDSFSADRTAHTDSQQAVSITLASSVGGGAPGGGIGGGAAGVSVPQPQMQIIQPTGEITYPEQEQPAEQLAEEAVTPQPIKEEVKKEVVEEVVEQIKPALKQPEEAIPEQPSLSSEEVSPPVAGTESVSPVVSVSEPSFGGAIIDFAKGIAIEAKVSLNQTFQDARIVIQKTTGEVKEIVNTPEAQAAAKTTTVVSVTVAVAQGIAGTVLPQVNSLSDLYSLIVRAVTLLGSAKRKTRRWGVVYDSETKRPLDPAYVAIENEQGKIIEEKFTDMDGRFGFLVPAGRYKISAAKTNYAFPSTKLKGMRDELYDNLYYGETVDVKDASIINVNIPLDPVGVDWNEEIKKKIMKFNPVKEIIKKNAFSFLFWGGLIISPLVYWAVPSLFNLAIILVYVTLLVLREMGFKEKNYGRIYDKITGQPLSFAKIKVYLVDAQQLITQAVADITGKYYILVVDKGKYRVEISGKTRSGREVSYEFVREAPEKVINWDVRV